jgi:hypothetical protein
MPSRTARLKDFTTDAAPDADSLVEVLCEDHVGTYLLPYMCRSTQEGFRNDRTGELIQARVVGWRAPIRGPRKRELPGRLCVLIETDVAEGSISS